MAIFENKEKEVCYKLLTQEETEKRKGLSVDEMFVMQHVEEAGA